MDSPTKCLRELCVDKKTLTPALALRLCDRIDQLTIQNQNLRRKLYKAAEGQAEAREVLGEANETEAD